MKIFKTFEKIEGMGACCKNPITIHAMKIDEPFRVESLEGEYAQGKPGDYLMCGVRGELYICDAQIFNETYHWV